jgi:hypothetical protein
MSCYEWEKGTIRIPAAQWAAFRKGLLATWNKGQERFLADLKEAHAAVKAAGKGKRGDNRTKAMTDALHRKMGSRWCYEWKEWEASDKFDRAYWLLFKRDPKTGQTKLGSTPTKKVVKVFPVSKDATLNIDGAEVTFCNATKTVSWYVYENNRARAYARNQPFAKELFRALNGIKWTRGSGGTIVGNDEYNRDADYEGGGANYVVSRYGPK